MMKKERRKTKDVCMVGGENELSMADRIRMHMTLRTRTGDFHYYLPWNVPAWSSRSSRVKAKASWKPFFVS